MKIRGVIPLHRCAAIDIYDLLLRENAKQCDGIQKDYRLAQPPFLGWLDVKWQTFRDGESIIISEVENKQEMGL